MIIIYLLSFMFHVSLCVSSGIYLFQREIEYECYSVNNEDDMDSEDPDLVDVSYRFYTILCIYFAMTIAGSVKNLCSLIGVFSQKTIFLNFANLLCLNDCLVFAAFIIISVYRFQLSGKICSGDYLDGDSEPMDEGYVPSGDSESYLMDRGHFLYGAMIASWVFCGTLCCINCIAGCILRK